MVNSIRLICGDSLKVVKGLERVKAIFMDPPDNIGLGYVGFDDRMGEEEYYDWIESLIRESMLKSDIVWISYNWIHDLEIKYRVRGLLKYGEGVWEHKTFLWRYTFGQYRDDDCPAGFRYILRLKRRGIGVYVDEIKVESVRQKIGDKRAAGLRTPDTVWDIPRVTGNSKERRAWHPTQHPEELMMRVVRMSVRGEEIFVDLFEGSGTSIRVCKKLQRNHIGVELSDYYVNKLIEEHPDIQSQ